MSATMRFSLVLSLFSILGASVLTSSLNEDESFDQELFITDSPTPDFPASLTSYEASSPQEEQDENMFVAFGRKVILGIRGFFGGQDQIVTVPEGVEAHEEKTGKIRETEEVEEIPEAPQIPEEPSEEPKAVEKTLEVPAITPEITPEVPEPTVTQNSEVPEGVVETTPAAPKEAQPESAQGLVEEPTEAFETPGNHELTSGQIILMIAVPLSVLFLTQLTVLVIYICYDRHRKNSYRIGAYPPIGAANPASMA
ncbi:hypothetical protein L596_010726 [Steinernema carpocapsae]|uniref:Uncharacterized protein n=1 Tax=Steinernema carpocapsae TaxID=34508 RepID=A0A4U5PJD7_STECR|nr:hypothetical protein L596_010726 [Steinernema carpocapsae]